MTSALAMVSYTLVSYVLTNVCVVFVPEMYYEDYDYPVATVPGDTTILAVIACFLGWTTLYFSLVSF